MMSEIINFLVKREWSMGNGQCPECYGVPPSWHGHPSYNTSENIGHKAECIQAKMMCEVGLIPLIIGDYKSDVVYEQYWQKMPDGNSISTTRVKKI